MVEVIRRAEKQKVECNRCKALLAYTYEDVKTNHSQRDYYTYIVCPDCNNRIEVKANYQTPFWERDR